MAARRDKNRRVLRKGEGQDKTGRYFFRWTDGEGRRRKVSAGSLEELREKEEKVLREEKEGRSRAQSLTACFEAALGLKETAGGIKEGTRQRYRLYWQNQVGSLGDLPAGEVTGAQLQALLAGIVGQGYSKTVVQGVKIVLNLALRYAVSARLRRDNPMEEWLVTEISRSARRVSHHHALTQAQEDGLLRYVFSQDPGSALGELYERLLVLFGTGLRFGELSGLTWADVLLSEGALLVRRQAIYDREGGGGKHWRIDSPKSEAGIRKVYLPEDVTVCLGILREKSGERETAVIDGVSGFCFAGGKGTLMEETRFNRLLKRAVEGYNRLHPGDPLPPFTAHAARTTNITRRAEGGTPDRVIKNQVGHREKDRLMETYAQLVDEEKLKRAALEGLPFSGHPQRGAREKGDPQSRERAKDDRDPAQEREQGSSDAVPLPEEQRRRRLYERLLEEGRTAEMEKAVLDEDLRKELYREYSL